MNPAPSEFCNNALRKVEFEESALHSRRIRRIVAADGGLPNCDPATLVNRVRTLLRNDPAVEVFDAYPQGFAESSDQPAEDIAAFAFTFYCMGPVPKFGENINGRTEKKIERFISQYIDCLHIGEAAFCQAFVTMDKPAYRLAAAVYKHAGVIAVPCLVSKSNKAF